MHVLSAATTAGGAWTSSWRSTSYKLTMSPDPGIFGGAPSWTDLHVCAARMQLLNAQNLKKENASGELQH